MATETIRHIGDKVKVFCDGTIVNKQTIGRSKYAYCVEFSGGQTRWLYENELLELATLRDARNEERQG